MREGFVIVDSEGTQYRKANGKPFVSIKSAQKAAYSKRLYNTLEAAYERQQKRYIEGTASPRYPDGYHLLFKIVTA